MNQQLWLELAEALDDPVASLDYWLAAGEPETAAVVRDAVGSLTGRDTATDLAVLRMVTSIRPQVGATKEIAARFGVTSAAVSQRRSSRLAAIHALRTHEVVGSHPFVVLWRGRARQLVCLGDLPPWMRCFLSDSSHVPVVGQSGEVNEPAWGTNQDVVRTLLHVAIDRPVLAAEPSEGHEWMLARGPAIERESEVDLREAFEHLATEVSGDDYVCLDPADYETRLLGLGVAPASLDRVRRCLQGRPVRRALEGEGRVLVMSHNTSARAANVLRIAQRELGLSESAAIGLIAAAHDRKPASLRADLRLHDR